MLDRQDIDALLIGSLYGELSSTEEARLAAHLESHPADRTALADLTHARTVVRESRILQVQFEPPQSISALLMQEAVRRAPKPAEEAGWFQRFMRSFMGHPAMAAAVMLVLVAGVAGTMYMRKGDHFANQYKDAPALTTDQSVRPESKEPLAQQPREQQNAGSAAGSATTESFPVDLHEELDGKKLDRVVGSDDSDVVRNDVKGRSNETTKAGELGFEAGAKTNVPKTESKPEPKPKNDVAKADVAKTAPAKKSQRYLEVTTPSQTPKDLPAMEDKLAKESGDTIVAGRTVEHAAGAGGGPSTGVASKSPAAPVAKPPTADVADNRPADAKTTAAPTASPDRTRAPAPPPPPPAEAEKSEKQEKKLSDADLAWAKEQHNKLLAQVKANRCDLAAPIAIQIASRTPSYYSANVENDRAVKGCIAMINAQRERELEKNQRSKATVRRVDEAPAPAKSTK